VFLLMYRVPLGLGSARFYIKALMATGTSDEGQKSRMLFSRGGRG